MDLDSLSGVSFAAVGLGLLVLERLAHGREFAMIPWTRWLTNIGLMVAGVIVSSLLFAESLTRAAGELDGGLIAGLRLPLAVEVVTVFLLLDFWRYWEHRLFHEVPLLWRLHLVHHSDTQVDVTTAQRHHPLEGALTTVLILTLLFSMGFSPVALGTYLLVATVSSLYTHTSLVLPAAVDRWLRYWLVTPSVHGIHHSAYRPQTDSNYGSVLSIWDRLFGTFTDPAGVSIERVGLEQFRRPGDDTLAAALLQPVEYRAAGGLPESPPGESAESRSEAPRRENNEGVWQRAAVTGAAGALLVLLGMWPTVVDLAGIWNSADSYHYAWLVLPTFVYLLGWYHREELLSASPAPGLAGIPVAGFALLLWLAAGLVEINAVRHLALVLALQGVALCALGTSVYRRFLPHMLLLFFAVPCGDLIQPLLRDLTVKWIEWFALALDFPFSREGYTFHVGEHRYVVIDACAGLATFTMAGFLGYSFGLMLYHSPGRVLAMAAAGALLGIVSNALRVCSIVALDQWRGSQMSLDDHGDIQMVLLVLLLAAMLVLACRLPLAAPRRPGGATEPSAGGPLRRNAPLVAGLLVAAVAGFYPALDPVSQAHASAGETALSALARHYPGSRLLPSGQGETSAVLSLPVDTRTEARVYAGLDHSARPPWRTLVHPETGWRHSATRSVKDCAAGGCIEFTDLLWTRSGSNQRRHTVYAYFAGERITNSRVLFRLLNGWQRLGSDNVASGMVAFHFAEAEETGQPRLADMFYNLKNQALRQ